MKNFFLVIGLLCINSAFGQVDFIKEALSKAEEKKYEEALILVDSVLAVDSSNFNFYTIKAEFLWMSKNYYQAALIYQKALLMDEDHRFLNGAYLMLGVLYEKAGLRVQAQIQYLRAIYFLETRKRKDDKLFLVPNKIDYVTAIILSGNDKEIKKISDDPFYKSYLEPYIGKSRNEVLEIFFKPFSGD